jgi:hypothetical protein
MNLSSANTAPGLRVFCDLADRAQGSAVRDIMSKIRSRCSTYGIETAGRGLRLIAVKGRGVVHEVLIDIARGSNRARNPHWRRASVREAKREGIRGVQGGRGALPACGGVLGLPLPIDTQTDKRHPRQMSPQGGA